MFILLLIIALLAFYLRANSVELIPWVLRETFPICIALFISKYCKSIFTIFYTIYTKITIQVLTISPAHINAHTCSDLKIYLGRLQCGIQIQCSWLKSLRRASDVTSACSVSYAPPPSPASLPLSYTLSSDEPIFWHFRRCSSHACHLSPPPPTLSS